MAERDTHRLKIKKTVEQIVPLMDIDATKVLSDEEIDELHRQTEQRVRAVRLASEVGRAGLRDRLKKTVMLFTPETEESVEEPELEEVEEFEEEQEED